MQPYPMEGSSTPDMKEGYIYPITIVTSEIPVIHETSRLSTYPSLPVTILILLPSLYPLVS